MDGVQDLQRRSARRLFRATAPAHYASLKLAGIAEAPAQVHGLRGSRDRHRARPRAAHHARDDRIFGGDRHPYDVAGGPGRERWTRLGVDPRPATRGRGAGRSRRAGASSATFASAIPKPRPTRPNSSASHGKPGCPAPELRVAPVTLGAPRPLGTPPSPRGARTGSDERKAPFPPSC